jgi:hypothetical protein
MANFIVGDLARVSYSITDEAGALVDPGNVSLEVQLPSGDLSYPTVTRTAAGRYYSDVPCAAAGQYLTRLVTTSPYIGVDEGEFLVSPSALRL